MLSLNNKRSLLNSCITGNFSANPDLKHPNTSLTLKILINFLNINFHLKLTRLSFHDLSTDSTSRLEACSMSNFKFFMGCGNDYFIPVMWFEKLEKKKNYISLTVEY